MKRIFSAIIVFCMFIVYCGAASPADAGIQASPTLASYGASLLAGSKSGEITLAYSVTATKPATKIGISSVKFCKANDGSSKTITGTTANGLLSSNTARKVGSYSYSGVAGSYYYAVVTFTATIDGVTDTKTVVTNGILAPH